MVTAAAAPGTPEAFATRTGTRLGEVVVVVEPRCAIVVVVELEWVPAVVEAVVVGDTPEAEVVVDG